MSPLVASIEAEQCFISFYLVYNFIIEIARHMQNSKKILVIDDSQTSLLIIEDVLLEAGYEVELCDNPKHALKKILHDVPDLIILDLILPKMDGLTFYEKIAHLCIPTIMISGKSNSILRERAKKEGIIGFMSKPIRVQQLIETINLIFTESTTLKNNNHYFN